MPAVFMRTGMAFTAEEIEALAELFAEDVVWHIQAATRSRATLRDALPPTIIRQSVRAFDGTCAVELHHVLADDDHTVALLRCTPSATARPWT